MTSANTAYDGAPRFSPDGRWIAYRSQKRPGFEADSFRLMLYDRTTGESRTLTEDFDSWVEEFQWDRDSRSLVFVSHVAATSAIFRVSLSGGPPQEIWRGGGAASLEVSPDGRKVFFVHSSLTRASAIWGITSRWKAQ